MTNTETRIAELEARLAALEERVENHLNPPEYVPQPRSNYDPTAGMSMDAETMRAWNKMGPSEKITPEEVRPPHSYLRRE